MTAPGFVGAEVLIEPLLKVPRTLVSLQVDILVLHAPPQALDEHIVDSAPLAAHAGSDLVMPEHAREGLGCELPPLHWRKPQSFYLPRP